jgi:signal transduction histidine kinase
VSNAKQLGTLVESWRQIPTLMREPMRPSLLDMNALARTAIEDALGGLDDSAKPQVVMEELPSSTADESALRQIWQQLVSNALAAMEGTADPVIRIGAAIGEGEVIYSVEDNGTGFPQEEHDRLFTPFDSFRDKDKRSGPGLGLFVAEQALARQRGRIWAEALPERGARFSFSLPQSSPPARQA